MPMPRVLLNTRNFPPLVGGMERLVFHCYRALSDTYPVDVVGPDGAERYLHGDSVAATGPAKPIWLFLAANLFHTLRLSWKRKPVLIFSGSGLTALSTFIGAKLRGAKSLCYVHGLDLVADNLIYRYLFIPALRRMDRVIANSQNTARLAEQSGINGRTITVIHPGIELSGDTASPANSFKQTYGVADKRLLLSVGRLSPRKGLAEFVRHGLARIVAVCPDTVLVIIGGEAEDAALSYGAQADQILSTARACGVGEHVKLVGRVDDESLSAAYQESELLVFPILERAGDVEGFGMVAVEAASHGLPTIAFSAGGVPDAVREGVSGFLIENEDYDAMSKRIIDQLNGCNSTITADSCKQFALQFSLEAFSSKLQAVVEATLAGRSPSL